MILATLEMKTNVMMKVKMSISGTLSAICGYCTDGCLEPLRCRIVETP